jgi:hypothetical protein
MKRLQRLITIACILAASATYADQKPAGKAKPSAKKAAQPAVPSYGTAKQIKAMPPCEAVVEQHGTCWALCKTTGGNRFYLDGLGGTEEVARFLQTLAKGKTYKLPGAFLDYMKTYREEE